MRPEGTEPAEFVGEAPFAMTQERAAVLHAVFAGMPDAVYVGDGDGVTLANQPALDQLGFTSAQNMRHSMEALASATQVRSRLTGEPFAVADLPFSRALRGERVVEDLVVRDRQTGRDRVLRCAASPVMLDGRLVAAITISTDISEQSSLQTALREGEERQAFLLRLSDAIEPLGEPHEIQTAAARLLRAHLQVDRVLFAGFASSGGAFPAVFSSDADQGAGATGTLSQEVLGALRSGHAVAVPDLDAEQERDGTGDRSVRSCLSIPLLRDGRLVAGVVVHHTAPRSWTAAQIALVQMAVERTWTAVEQARVEADIRRREAAFRESEARARFLVDGIAQATWEAATDGLIVADSPSWRAFTGQSYEEWSGYGWLDAIHPDDRASTLCKWHDAVRQRHAVDAEYRLRAKDGSYRWMNVRAVPSFGDGGRIDKWFGMNIDIDPRKRLEQAVRDNERRVSALMQGVPQLLWRADRAGEWTWASPQWSRFTGQEEQESHGRGWLSSLHPDDRATVLAAWAEAERSKGFDVECRLRRADGVYMWFGTRAVPVRDEAGEIAEWLGTSNDIDALRQAQGRQDVLVAELQHRTRNLIGVVQALAATTVDEASSLTDFEERFGHRLSALSRVQGLLSHATAGRRVTFDELLRSELVALGALGRGDDGREDDGRVVLDGPPGVPLRSGAVQSLALALHELATNAVKHGALRAPAGRLAIAWRVTEEAGVRWLRVDWRETGVTLPHVSADVGSGGYGRELIERALPYQLGARTSFGFGADGVRCTIEVPIVSARATMENG